MIMVESTCDTEDLQPTAARIMRGVHMRATERMIRAMNADVASVSTALTSNSTAKETRRMAFQELMQAELLTARSRYGIYEQWNSGSTGARRRRSGIREHGKPQERLVSDPRIHYVSYW
jgi:hypothetical protein